MALTFFIKHRLAAFVGVFHHCKLIFYLLSFTHPYPLPVAVGHKDTTAAREEVIPRTPTKIKTLAHTSLFTESI